MQQCTNAKKETPSRELPRKHFHQWTGDWQKGLHIAPARHLNTPEACHETWTIAYFSLRVGLWISLKALRERRRRSGHRVPIARRWYLCRFELRRRPRQVRRKPSCRRGRYLRGQTADSNPSVVGQFESGSGSGSGTAIASALRTGVGLRRAGTRESRSPGSGALSWPLAGSAPIDASTVIKIGPCVAHS